MLLNTPTPTDLPPDVQDASVPLPGAGDNDLIQTAMAVLQDRLDRAQVSGRLGSSMIPPLFSPFR
jgi:hypothetical protein